MKDIVHWAVTDHVDNDDNQNSVIWGRISDWKIYILKHIFFKVQPLVLCRLHKLRIQVTNIQVIVKGILVKIGHMT